MTAYETVKKNLPKLSIAELRDIDEIIKERKRELIPRLKISITERRYKCFVGFLNGESIKDMAKKFYISEYTITNNILWYGRIILYPIIKEVTGSSYGTLKLNHLIEYKKDIIEKLNKLPASCREEN